MWSIKKAYNPEVDRQLGKELRNGFTYVIGDIFSIGLRYAPAVIYPLFLSNADYGVFAVATAVSLVMGIVVVFGLNGAAFKQTFDYPEGVQRRQFYGSLWLFIALFGFALTLFVDMVWGTFFPRLFSNVVFSPYIRLALWGAYFNGFGAVLYEILRAQSQAKRYITFSISNALTMLIVAILLVGVFNMGLLGALLSPLVTGVLWAFIYSFALVPFMQVGFNCDMVKRALVYGLPLIPHQVGHWLLNLSDRIVLEAKVPLAQLGIYSLGYNISTAEQVLANAGNNTLKPHYGLAGANPKARIRLPDLFRDYIAWTAAGALGLAIFSDEVIKNFFPATYISSADIVPWVVLAFFTVSLYYGPMNALTIMIGETRWVWVFTLIAGVINLTANLVFVPRFGIQAAAADTLVGYSVLFGMIHAYTRRFTDLIYPWKRIAMICLTLVFGIMFDKWLVLPTFGWEAFSDLFVWGAFAFVFLLPQFRILGRHS